MSTVPKRIYIIGKMRGLPNWNFEEFDRVADYWRSSGWTVLSPAALDRACGYNSGSRVDDKYLKHVISMDIACIMSADAVAVIPGWEDSVGSTVEVALAQFLGLPIYCAKTCKELNLVQKPWEFHRKALDSIHRAIKTDIEELKQGD